MIAIMRAARRNGLRVPSGVVSIYRALLVAESVAHQLEANADLRSVGRRFFEGLGTEEMYRALESSNLQRIAMSALQLQRDGPGQMRQLLGNLVDGSFTVTVHTFEAPRVRRAWNRRLRMVVAAALSLGVTILLTRPDLPTEVTVLLTIVLVALYGIVAVLWMRLR
jgi:predicted unusual protein kinase regulating ubiquinone biosynthesis (AarF/ABC1/UbiB family)